jgi:multidrug transporter EmrE-like cation transporter
MKGRVAIVNSITSSSATAIPVVIGIFFLDESISLVKIITITILLAGIFILAKWGKIKTDILTIAKELVK